MITPRRFMVFGCTVELFHLERDEHVPSHVHAYHQFLAVTEGAIELSLREVAYGMRAGESIVFRPGEAHAFTARERSTVLSVFDSNLDAAPFDRLVADINQGRF